jgi:hypothetical protein
MGNLMSEAVLDFEFFGANNEHPTLVCAALAHKTYWLLDNSDTTRFKNDLKKFKKLIVYYGVAESRCLLALKINPLNFEWVDLYAEFKMLQNSNNQYLYGTYIDSAGLKKFSEPKNFREYINQVNNEDDDEEMLKHNKVPSNLINAVFKMTQHVLSSLQKNQMREIIISGNVENITNHKKEIMEYCLSDVSFLYAVRNKIEFEYYRLGLRNFEESILDRGLYSACIGICEQIGIPINKQLLDKIIAKTPEIIKDSRDAVNALSSFPIYIPEIPATEKHFKNGAVKIIKSKPERRDNKAIQKLIESFEIPSWPKTETGFYKTDSDTIESYRTIPVIEEMYKCNKTESSLKWFREKNSDGFFAAYDFKNDIVRPFYGIYGTQTGRNAAKAKTYPLAMSSWLRAIIQPKPGTVIIAADFSQQEIAVAAWLSQDKNLINAYNSGDVYLEFAKQAGAVPMDATKKTHERERDLFKSTKLGLQYGMGAEKLRLKLTYDCKRTVSLEETQALITAHKTVYAEYWNWVYEISKQYKSRVPLVTSDGWVLWTDNPIMTSVRNFHVQAHSASITRQAVVDACKANLKVMSSLHDALYIISQEPTKDLIILKQIMRNATEKILGENCIEIRIDDKILTDSEIWVEKKGQADWSKIKTHII